VALGSTLATVMLNKNVALADGVLGFFLLIFLQYGITYLAVRSKSFSNLIKSTPTLVLYKGKILQESIRKNSASPRKKYMRHYGKKEWLLWLMPALWYWKPMAALRW
jgi:uncharacterized membrane protein YcaP (DUF421 family)